MKESFKAVLCVNNVAVELNPFVEDFLSRTVCAAVSSLKGAEDIQSLELYLERDNLNIIVNDHDIPITPFPQDIITNTIIGLVSSLKGMGKIDNLKISVQEQ